MNKKNVLVVEDEITTLKLINYTLQSHNFNVFLAENSSSAMCCLENNRIDIILLDLNLPDISGFEFIKKIKSNPKYNFIPIIILTISSDKLDVVLSLEMGADDYITKPFHKRELIARINVSLRKSNASNYSSNSRLIFGDLVIDLENRSVFKSNDEIILTFKEFELLILFARNAGKVFSRNEILTDIWGYDYITETRTVDMHISSLRKKIENSHENNCFIETIRGVGYRFRK